MKIEIPEIAMVAFDFESTPKECRGWSMFKDGSAYNTPGRSKRDLLIGYDLLTLQGLRKCELALQKNGITAGKCAIESDHSSTLFAVARRGKIVLDSAVWSTFSVKDSDVDNVAARSFQSACGWIHCQNKHEASTKNLGMFWYSLRGDENRWMPVDKRRVSTYQKLIADCASTIRRLGYSLVPVSVRAI